MDNYFVFVKAFFSTLGQWPHQSWFVSKFCQYFWTMQHLSIMIPEAIKAYESRKNFDLLMECLPNLLYNTGMALKFVNGIVNRHKIKLVLEKIEQDWHVVQKNKGIIILQDFNNTGRLLSITYIGLVYFVLLSFMLLPLTPTILDVTSPLNDSRPKRPLYIAEFFVDQDKYYYTILMHAYVTSLMGILPLFGNDLFVCNCVHHACGMLTILGHQIKSVVKTTSPKENVDDNKMYEKAVDCVIQHQNIIQFCDDVNNIYSSSFFYILGTAIVLMSITGFVTVIKLEESFNECFRFAMFTVAQIFHMFCYNFLGQKLVNQGEEFLSCIWESDWHLASKKTKDIFKFMIIRGLKPKKLHAKIFPLTLENFTSVLKTCMSYFTVLKSTR